VWFRYQNWAVAGFVSPQKRHVAVWRRSGCRFVMVTPLCDLDRSPCMSDEIVLLAELAERLDWPPPAS
jgi:hypothetical protein